ncbi:hypothetical protein BH24ACT3_BH24ACT3_15800 [soil metagenome]
MTDRPPDSPTDPVLRRRARIARLVGAGQRLGSGLFSVAMGGFFLGIATRFTDGLASVIVACLLAGSVVLAPAIVFGYAVKAAEREDRQRGT